MQIAIDTELNAKSVNNCIDLFKQDATIPFIARYRKEMTGGLDEVQILQIYKQWIYYKELEERKITILKSIEEQGKLTPELSKLISDCKDKQLLEDLYLPYKQKRKTRASMAIEKGLGPLAKIIIEQTLLLKNKDDLLVKYVNLDKGVSTPQEALQGALDIIAETISDNADYRKYIRQYISSKGILLTKVKKDWVDKSSKYEMYYNFSEPLNRAASHRILAIRRAEQEAVIGWKIEIQEQDIFTYLEAKIIKNKNFIFFSDLRLTIADSFKRLLFPALETEAFTIQGANAEKEAIAVFATNLRNLLLTAPAGQKCIIGIDPGFRTGCKIVVIDENSKLLKYTSIFPHEPVKEIEKSEKIICELISQYKPELIAIGNGTASKETMQFIKKTLTEVELKVIPVIVSEAGASVYSASDIARAEFPELDLTVRGAIAIARRLQDPLSELVKVDPKSIGVGQYQHDVNQKDLSESLQFEVEYCVNKVGVELNTATSSILGYVSGIGPALAKNIVQYRAVNGAFPNRKALMKVPKLGAKAFLQCAGFLRVRNSNNPLDNSAIHPESYAIVETMAKDLAVCVKDIIGYEAQIKRIDIAKYKSDTCGELTLQDVIKELNKPGIDPRAEFSYADFSSEINEISDLKIDMVIEGVVTNVANFGAFVDIGVHQDGLIHISKLSDKFIRNPSEVVAVGNKVKVKVLSVDMNLKRISLERIP